MFAIQVSDNGSSVPRLRQVRPVWESRVGWCVLYLEDGAAPSLYADAADAVQIAKGIATTLPMRVVVIETKTDTRVSDSVDWPHKVAADPLNRDTGR